MLLLRVLWKTIFKEFSCSGTFICMCFNIVLLFFYFICEISSSEEIETPPSATLRKDCEECFECVNSDSLSGSAYSFWRTLGWQVHSPSGIHCILMILLVIFHILQSFLPYHPAFKTQPYSYMSRFL